MEAPEIECKDCHKKQEFVGQRECAHCQARLTPPQWMVDLINNTVVLNGQLVWI